MDHLFNNSISLNGHHVFIFFLKKKEIYYIINSIKIENALFL